MRFRGLVAVTLLALAVTNVRATAAGAPQNLQLCNHFPR